MVRSHLKNPRPGVRAASSQPTRITPEKTNPCAPFGLYVHTPFCVHKCSYCDFYSFTQYEKGDFEPLVALLERDISQGKKHWDAFFNGVSRPLSSVFIGGGTPSLIPHPLIARILEKARQTFGFQESIEITMEMNPETVTQELLEGLREHGFLNRISLGAQSFVPRPLKALERQATPESVVRAVGLLEKSGFSNFSLDLIVGIPDQTHEEIRSDIERAVALGPKHLSVYQLTLKPGHPLYRLLPNEDAVVEHYQVVEETLLQFGYEQYEISNYSKDGFRCQHNLLYWQGGDFLGIGPSASSRILVEGRARHHKQPADMKAYAESVVKGLFDFETSDHKQTVLESAFLEFRMNDGVDIDRFRERYGYDLTQAPKWNLFQERGLLTFGEGIARLTKAGKLLADSVTSELVDYGVFADRGTINP